MKKYISCVAGALLLGFAAASLASEAPSESSGPGSIVVLADTTGSMQEKVELTDENGGKEEISKILSLKKMLLKLAGEHSFSDYQIGIYGARYIGGTRAYYDTLLPFQVYSAEDLSESISKGMTTDYSVFNRRSATANALRQLDKAVIRHLSGPVTVLIASDGIENMHDLEKDREVSREKMRNDYSVVGLLSEIKILKMKYGDRLKVFTLFWEQTNDEQHTGKMLLSEVDAEKHFTLWDFNADALPEKEVYQALTQVKGAE